MSYIIEVFLRKKKYYWRLKAGNGKVLAHSEIYNTKQSVRHTARKLALNLKQCEYKEINNA